MNTDNTDRPVAHQQKIFDDFWRRFSRQIEHNEGQVDFPSHSEIKPLYTTTVVRLPSELAQTCFDAVERIRIAYPGHYHYPATDMHFTLLNLDKLVAQIGGQLDAAAVAHNIQQALASLPPLKIIVRGLGLFPTTIFAQVYDVTGVLEMYRDAIKTAVLHTFSLSQTDTTAVAEGIAFVNIARFTYTPEPALVPLVNDLRDINLGAFTVTAVELVETNRLLSASETLIKGNIILANK